MIHLQQEDFSGIHISSYEDFRIVYKLRVVPMHRGQCVLDLP